MKHSQVFPLPDIQLLEVYHLCLVSRSLGFEPPKEKQIKRDWRDQAKLHSAEGQ